MKYRQSSLARLVLARLKPNLAPLGARFIPYKTLVYLNVWVNVDLANWDLPHIMGPILQASLPAYQLPSREPRHLDHTWRKKFDNRLSPRFPRFSRRRKITDIRTEWCCDGWSLKRSMYVWSSWECHDSIIWGVERFQKLSYQHKFNSCVQKNWLCTKNLPYWTNTTQNKQHKFFTLFLFFLLPICQICTQLIPKFRKVECTFWY